MLKKQAGNLVGLPHEANRHYLEHEYCEIVSAVYQAIGECSLGNFTFSLVDSLWNNLNAVVNDLERLHETSFIELIGVIISLTEARNELRLARFLFGVEEINPIHRLVMRNRAVLRSHSILRKILLVRPVQEE